jgi:hypothetical protein
MLDAALRGRLIREILEPYATGETELYLEFPGRADILPRAGRSRIISSAACKVELAPPEGLRGIRQLGEHVLKAHTIHMLPE